MIKWFLKFLCLLIWNWITVWRVLYAFMTVMFSFLLLSEWLWEPKSKKDKKGNRAKFVEVSKRRGTQSVSQFPLRSAQHHFLNTESLPLNTALLNHQRWTVSVIFLDKQRDGKHSVCFGGEKNNSSVTSWQKKITNQFAYLPAENCRLG